MRDDRSYDCPIIAPGTVADGFGRGAHGASCDDCDRHETRPTLGRLVKSLVQLRPVEPNRPPDKANARLGFGAASTNDTWSAT